MQSSCAVMKNFKMATAGHKTQCGALLSLTTRVTFPPGSGLAAACSEPAGRGARGRLTHFTPHCDPLPRLLFRETDVDCLWRWQKGPGNIPMPACKLLSQCDFTAAPSGGGRGGPVSPTSDSMDWPCNLCPPRGFDRMDTGPILGMGLIAASAFS